MVDHEKELEEQNLKHAKSSQEEQMHSNKIVFPKKPFFLEKKSVVKRFKNFSKN